MTRAALFLTLAVALPAKAQSPFGGGNPAGPPPPLTAYEGRLSPGVAGGPSVQENKINLVAPVLNAKDDNLALSLTAGNLRFGRALTLDSGRAVPTDLYRLETGAQYGRSLGQGRTMGVRATVGAAGDRPFTDSRDVTYGANVSYGYPGNGGGYWLYFLFYSNNASIANGVPIPGVAYAFRTPTWAGIVGLPFAAVTWTPSPTWAHTFNWLGINARAESAYGLKTKAFLGFGFTTQSFLPDDRPHQTDRLTLREMKLGLGVRGAAWPGVMLEAQAGPSFGRAVYLGRGTFAAGEGQRNLPDDWTLNVGAKYLF